MESLNFGQNLADGDFALGLPMRVDIENLAGVRFDEGDGFLSVSLGEVGTIVQRGRIERFGLSFRELNSQFH
jgi:hypothetical protein